MNRSDSVDAAGPRALTVSHPRIRPSPQREDLVLPGQDSGKLAFTLHNFLTPEECAMLIAEGEKSGFEAALVNIGNGRQRFMPDVRQGERYIADDKERAAELYARLLPFLSSTFKNHRPVGVNERLRFLKYTAGDYFKPHRDGCYERPDGSEISLVTLQIYLNDGGATESNGLNGFGAGTTRFLDPYKSDRYLDVVPRTGQALVFEHSCYHEGAKLTHGTKYAIRTDVMYRMV